MTAEHRRRAATDPAHARPEELDDARARLLVHRLDPDTGRCAACAGCCPCQQAQAAAHLLAQAGAWNTIPFTGPVGWQTDREPSRAADGWLARLVRLVRRRPGTAAR